MFNPLITATAGWSEAVEERAKRFLAFPMGGEVGAPVTMATLLERAGQDPVNTARYLMIVPPLAAQRELIGMIGAFRIDGEPCPDPVAAAHAALSYAGRAVTMNEIHPERRWLAALLCALFGGRRQPH